MSGVSDGTQLTVKWLGKPVFIRNRTVVAAYPRNHHNPPPRQHVVRPQEERVAAPIYEPPE